MAELAATLPRQRSVHNGGCKLRAEFNDQLFVRTARGMVPTPQAERIVEKARPLLEQLQSKALLQDRFDPATARQAFCFALSDVGEMVFLPALLANLHREAPLASARSLSMSPAEIASGMERGTVDLAIGFYPDLKQSHFFQQRLFMTMPHALGMWFSATNANLRTVALPFRVRGVDLKQH